MTGPEHYRRAEQLEQLAVRQFEGTRIDEEHGYDPSPLWQLTIQQAQVHATLALTAATALDTAGVPQDGDTAGEWRRAICAPKIVNTP